MRISAINNYKKSSNNDTNFRSAIPVFIYVGKTVEQAAPITDKKFIRGYRQQLEYYINNTLKRGKNLKRDEYIDKLRTFCAKHLPDFDGKIKSFGCMDGGREENILKPLFYLATAKEKEELIKLEKEFKETRKASDGYITAEFEKMNNKYHLKGKSIIERGFKRLKKISKPVAMHVYFDDIYTRSGNIQEHRLINIKISTIDDKNPHIILKKQSN